MDLIYINVSLIVVQNQLIMLLSKQNILCIYNFYRGKM